jgi:YHS domain-containing protein
MNTPLLSRIFALAHPFLRKALALGLLLLGISALAAPPINTLTNSSFLARTTGIAIVGYDTVAYFTQNKAVKGSDEYTHQWNGAKWRFSSIAHLDLFKANPEKYAPQYGGYCAYGVAGGYLVKIDPTQFTVTGGKLYLNYDAGVQKDWLKDIKGYNAKADTLFKGLLAK